MEILKLLPKWALVFFAFYLAAATSFAIYDNRAIHFWPPSIEARQVEIAKERSSHSKCGEFAKFDGLIFGSRLRQNRLKLNFDSRMSAENKADGPGEGMLSFSCGDSDVFLRIDGATDDTTCLCHGTVRPPQRVLGQCFCSLRSKAGFGTLVRFDGQLSK